MAPKKYGRVSRTSALLISGGLVHPHVHLDKCYLLEQTPIGDGSFSEALAKTGEAKAKFTHEDLIARGDRLLKASLQHGITAVRAHVEVDPAVDTKCLQAGLELCQATSDHLDVKLVAFAQDPLFYPENQDPENQDPENQDRQAKMQHLFKNDVISLLMLNRNHITAVGSTPYVEKTPELALRNIDFIIDLARTNSLDVDFHLDYNLDREQQPTVFYVLDRARSVAFEGRITIGHATRLSLFSQEEWDLLARSCDGLDVAFVALPPSDLYMQGRDLPYAKRNRASLPVLELVKRNIPVSMGVNNVCNLFTPQGDADPMALLPLAVALWQSAIPAHLEAFLSMVSTAAAHAAGARIHQPERVDARLVDFEIDDDNVVRIFSDQALASHCETFTLLPRCQSVQEAVLSPPKSRIAVVHNRAVGWTKVDQGVFSP